VAKFSIHVTPSGIGLRPRHIGPLLPLRIREGGIGVLFLAARFIVALRGAPGASAQAASATCRTNLPNMSPGEQAD